MRSRKGTGGRGALQAVGIERMDGALAGSSKEAADGQKKAKESSTRERIRKVKDVKTNIAVKTWSKRFH